MVTTISSYTAPTTTQTGATDTTQATSTDTSANTSTTESSTGNSNQFSTRAAQLAQLNQEFDIVSPGFRLSQEFVNRMAELGLISNTEAESLGSDLPVNADGTSETDSVSELNGVIDVLAERYAEDTSLIEILNNSKEILNHLDGSNSEDWPVDPFTAAAEIENYLNSDEADKLSAEETQSLEDLKLAMTIADRLSPENRTSAELSQYMEILNQYS